MSLFRRKPLIVEATQFWPTPQHTLPLGVIETPGSPTGYGLYTLEHTGSPFEVTPGDWIITGVVGERYACKPDVFEKIYEPVEKE